jgi:cytochrome c-type biogenesis protein
MAVSISLPAAFVAGLLSFLSPCVLPLVPAYLSYMSGVSVEDLTASGGWKAMRQTGLKSILFVLGFSVVFVALGATATSLGQILSDRAAVLMKVGAVVVIVFGLHMTGIFRIKALYSEKRFHAKLNGVGLLGAFLIGVTFAFGWTPCIGPVLAAILSLAMKSESVTRGIALLAAYSLGLGVPFLVAGFATGTVFAAMRRFRAHFRKVEIASGVLVVFIGVLVFTGKLTMLSALASRWFPQMQ